MQSLHSVGSRHSNSLELTSLDLLRTHHLPFHAQGTAVAATPAAYYALRRASHAWLRSRPAVAAASARKLVHHCEQLVAQPRCLGFRACEEHAEVGDDLEGCVRVGVVGLGFGPVGSGWWGGCEGVFAVACGVAGLPCAVMRRELTRRAGGESVVGRSPSLSSSFSLSSWSRSTS